MKEVEIVKKRLQIVLEYKLHLRHFLTFRLHSSFGLLIALQQISLRRGYILTTSV